MIPAQKLDLTNWKLTRPNGKEITDLSKFSDKYFFADTLGVTFEAPVNGSTTPNSTYPRSELREMKDGKLASWSTRDARSLYIEQAIYNVPKTKKHVVAGQIHGANDDVVVIRLEHPKLFIDINGKNGPTLDPHYILGKRFSVEFQTGNKEIKILYNGQLAHTMKKDISGCYFKAGCYTQSNCSKESDCSDSNYGKVIITKLILDKPMIKIENQLDPKWAKWYIGKVKTSKFKDFACFLFCWVYMYSVKQGKQISPGAVDKLFIDNGVYDEDMIISEKAAKALGLQYFGKEFDINKPPAWSPSIKEVDFSIVGGKQSHFVVREVVNGKRVILDPYGGQQRAINYYEKKTNNPNWDNPGFSYRLVKI